MKVYVVLYWHLSGDEEFTEVMGVFADKEYAQKYINENRGYPANNEWFIEEHELQALPKSYKDVDDWYKQ